MSFGIVINTDREPAISCGKSLVTWLQKRKIPFFIDKESNTPLHLSKALQKYLLAKEEMHKACDIFISLGGDGTLLGVSRVAQGKPILGINFGRLGFLAEFSDEELFPALERIVQNQFQTETRTLLEVAVSQEKREKVFTALNDVIIEKGGYPRLPLISLRIDGHLLADYKADGIIIATSTGSTAYSMSAGGPIIIPKSRVFVITPICPHMLTVRPIVINDEKEIEIMVETPAPNFVLNCDGNIQLKISPKDRLRVYKSEQQVLLIKNEQRNYYDVLRSKFLWGREYTR
ncbi:MAG: NAD(+)/NADH kinase [Chloroherpetonaceae bacterium]|nr:NAD(+)/NADH kinase [Chloroherpetonaceae bacterium]